MLARTVRSFVCVCVSINVDVRVYLCYIESSKVVVVVVVVEFYFALIWERIDFINRDAELRCITIVREKENKYG